jgi:hypothetical protein
MEKKDFVEITTSTGIALISLSSIAMVEPNGTGATIIMKEINKDNVSYVIITTVSYYIIRQAIDNWKRL